MMELGLKTMLKRKLPETLFWLRGRVRRHPAHGRKVLALHWSGQSQCNHGAYGPLLQPQTLGLVLGSWGGSLI